MKRIYFLLIPLFLASCNPSKEERHTVKPMPSSEIAFIKKITAIDSNYDAQKNEITKKEYVEKGKKEMEAYLLKNLDIKDWVVKVSRIESNSAPVDYISLEVFVPIGNWREEKISGFKLPDF